MSSTSKHKRIGAIILNKPKHIHTVTTLIRDLGVDYSESQKQSIRKILNRYVKLGLVKVYPQSRSREKAYSLNTPAKKEPRDKYNKLMDYYLQHSKLPSELETKHKVQDGKGGHLNAHSLRFSMKVEGLPKVDRLPYDKEKTRMLNNSLMRYAPLRISQVIDIPDYKVVVHNSNNKNLQITLQAITLEYDTPEKAKTLDTIIDRLKWCVWRILESQYGFKLSAPKTTIEVHYAFPEPSLVGKLDRGMFHIDDDTWVDFSPRQIDKTTGEPVPQLETTSRERRDRIMSLDERVATLEVNHAELREEMREGFLKLTEFQWENREYIERAVGMLEAMF
ncbi:MAG: hypothetical protein LN417_04230, partial [Candidatus Thermoplasmatota archaeon]|nr:hypothetical protein [Candidatus Thermoplasmatota archaeon]